mgnify:CR=1 FL=1
MRIILAALALTAATALSPAHAGPYGDDLSKCLVASTSPEEKGLLVDWIFTSIALNPRVSNMAQVPKERREAINRGTAGLYTKLLGETCLDQTRLALQYEGQGAIGSAFQLLGQVAAQQIFADPAVTAGTEEFANYIDTDALQKAFEKK